MKERYPFVITIARALSAFVVKLKLFQASFADLIVMSRALYYEERKVSE